jgi:hypothetical protein
MGFGAYGVPVCGFCTLKDDHEETSALVAELRTAISDALAILGREGATNYEKVQAAGLVLIGAEKGNGQ